MLRVERAPGSLAVVSRLARAPAVAVLSVLLLAVAVATRATPAVAAPVVVAAALLVVLGGRAVRSRFERGRVIVRHAVPFRRDDRPLSDFSAARVETIADARRRRAARLAHQYRERSGGAEMPSWFRPAGAPGTNDQLRRVVLVGGRGEPLEVTAWLAEEDLEPLRAELDALLR